MRAIYLVLLMGILAFGSAWAAQKIGGMADPRSAAQVGTMLQYASQGHLLGMAQAGGARWERVTAYCAAHPGHGGCGQVQNIEEWGLAG